MRSIHFLSVLLGFCTTATLATSPALAQRKGNTSASSAAGSSPKKTLPKVTAPLRRASASTKDYRLGAEDVLQVNVLGEPSLSIAQIKVDSSGKIRLPMVGSITVTGKTIGQVTKEITVILDRELLHPDVTVTLLQSRPAPIQHIVVSGAVQKPGIYDLSNGWRVSEVLAAAGGLSTRAELVRATLSRGKQPVELLDLTAILRDPGSRANIQLRGGDTIRIAETTFPIRIAGQVKLPGLYDVPIGSSLDDAMALAGGLAARAAVRKATITRVDGTVIPVDLTPGRGAGEEVKLATGDLILVPESNDRVALLGAVARPGYFDIDAGTTMRISQALVLAGGVTSRAALTRANLVRTDGTVHNVDLFGLLVRGDQTRNITIEPGDIITVPEAVGVSVYGSVKTPGTFTVEEGRTPVLSDVLTVAGGLSAPPEDVSIRITRRPVLTEGAATMTSAEGSPTPTTLTFAKATDSDVLDTRIYDGDSILVEALKTQFVSVQGQVKNPGSFEVKEGTSLVEAINRAGGPTDLASLTKVVITHKNSTSEQVDIRAALQDGAPEPVIKLQSGDYVVVPENKKLVYVMEAVNRPGYIPVPETGTLTVGQAISKAGGPKDRAKLWQVAIFHQTPTGTTQNVLNLKGANSAIDGLNTPLQPGDVLYVPQGRASGGLLNSIGRSVGLLNIFRMF